jgi:hypothetical protein
MSFEPVLYDLDQYLAGEPSDDMTEAEIEAAEAEAEMDAYDRWLDNRGDA